jgi:hypothetical protein
MATLGVMNWLDEIALQRAEFRARALKVAQRRDSEGIPIPGGLPKFKN